jgi:hypothetical protein
VLQLKFRVGLGPMSCIYFPETHFLLFPVLSSVYTFVFLPSSRPFFSLKQVSAAVCTVEVIGKCVQSSLPTLYLTCPEFFSDDQNQTRK